MIVKKIVVIIMIILLTSCKKEEKNTDDVSLIISPTPKTNLNFSDKLNEEISQGKLVLLQNDTLLDIDGDGTEDFIKIEVGSEDGRLQNYKLIINEKSIDGTYEVFYPDYLIQNTMYAIQLDQEKRSIQILIPEPEQHAGTDSKTAIYTYFEGELICLGRICGLPEDIIFSKDENNNILIKAKKQSSLIGSWYHDQEYRLVWDAKEASESKIPMIKEVTMDMYFIDGEIRVTMLRALPIYASKDSKETSIVFNEGEEIIFISSDDVNWVYAESVNYKDKKGYILVDSYNIFVGDELFYVTDVFEGNFLAD